MSKIAIDIDNTICNTTEFYGKMAIEYDREVLQKNNDIDFSKVMPRSEDWSQEELLYFVENYFNKEALNIPIKEDAVTYINKLKELGYEIVFITNRGIREDDHTDLIVPDYLRKHNIPYDKIITKSNDKYMYLDDVDYFIDDAIRNCEEALEKSKTKVIMFETDKTKDYENNKIFKTSSLEEIFNYITKYTELIQMTENKTNINWLILI